MAKPTQSTRQQLEINSGTVVGSVYSQIVGISISNAEATLEFIYINPQVPNKGVAVARVTLPLTALEQLAQKIPETLKRHDEKNKK